MNVIDRIQGILENDMLLATLLSTYKGFRAIAQENAPKKMNMPYIVMRNESDTQEANELLNRLVLSIDVFAENNKSTVYAIYKRLKDLLHRRRLMPDGIISILDRATPIESQDPSVFGLNVKFIIRYEL
ncbi:hypothetical protein LC040_12140 [Bacillus tianshenii]|nr:hypothetical protein LC040_12140 [Bacillus tianshenii]